MSDPVALYLWGLAGIVAMTTALAWIAAWSLHRIQTRTPQERAQ